MKYIKNQFLFGLAFSLFVTFSVIDLNAKNLELLKEKSFKVNSGELLTIKTDVGDVVVKTWNSDEVYVKIYGDTDAKRKMEFSFDQDEKGVEIIGEREGGRLFSWFSKIDLKYEIKVPSKFDLNIKSSGGDLVAKNIEGNFLLKTSGGDVYFNNSVGELKASTSGGDIVLANFEGNSELNTSGGDIKVDSENGDVYANTSGGDIKLKASDGRITGKTSGGDIDLKYIGENYGVELRTSGGDIDVFIPYKFSADVDLRTSGGDIDNDFSNNKMSKISKSKLIGKFNNGGEQLICKTSGGDITIREK